MRETIDHIFKMHRTAKISITEQDINLARQNGNAQAMEYLLLHHGTRLCTRKGLTAERARAILSPPAERPRSAMRGIAKHFGLARKLPRQSQACIQ